MLLHDHPVNVQRTSRGLPAINAVWLWGSGTVARAAAQLLPLALGADPYLTGIYRLHDQQRVQSAPTRAMLLSRMQSTQRVVLVPADDARHSGEPLARRRSSRARRLDVLLDARSDVSTAGGFHGRAMPLRRFWRRARPAGAVGQLLSRTIRRRAPGAARRVFRTVCIRCCGVCTRLAACVQRRISTGPRSADSGESARRHRGAVELLCSHYAAAVALSSLATSMRTAPRARHWSCASSRGLDFAQVGFIVPNRFEYGYGLTPEIVRLAAEQQPAAHHHGRQRHFESCRRAEATTLGIETLVTDHHLPASDAARGGRDRQSECAGRSIPEQGARGRRRRVLSHGRADARNAVARADVRQAPPVADLLDLVALGTVADLVPLDRNNRVLVQQGLRRIRAGRCLRRAFARCSKSSNRVRRAM